jgi:hypothetical protein
MKCISSVDVEETFPCCVESSAVDNENLQETNAKGGQEAEMDEESNFIAAPELTPLYSVHGTQQKERRIEAEGNFTEDSEYMSARTQTKESEIQCVAPENQLYN